MIYEFLKEFKSEVYNRFEQLDKRIDRLETRVDRIENQQMQDHKIMAELLESKDKVTIKFSRTFMGVNAFISGIVATIIAIFIKK